MGYLEDYDKFVINRCNEEKKYYNTLMNNLSNGNLTPSPMGDGSFVITRPKIEEVKEEVLNARKSNKDSIDLGEDVEIDIKVQEDVITPPIPVPPILVPPIPVPPPPTPAAVIDAAVVASTDAMFVSSRELPITCVPLT